VDVVNDITKKLKLSSLPVPTAVTTALATKQDSLVSGVTIKTVNSQSLLGAGDIPIPIVNPSGVAGAIQFSNGSAFASDAANFFWDDTNNRLGVGTNAPGQSIETTGGIRLSGSGSQSFEFSNASLAQFRAIFGGFSFRSSTGVFISNADGTPTARLHVKSSGSTSATTSLLVQDSAGTELIKVADNGDLTTIDIIARSIYAKASTLELRANKSGGTSSATLQGFVSGLGWLSMFTAESGKDFGQIPRGAVVNGTTIDASAIFQVNSTTKGFLPPRMTTTQRDAIVTPATGLKIYNTTLGTTDTYDGATWQRFGQQTLIKGSGSTFATKALLVQNSAGTNLLEVLDSGSCIVTGLTSNGSVAAQRFFVQGAAFPFSLPFAFDAGATSTANTSGVRDAYKGSFSYLPTSGTGELNIFNASPTINQTGGANGITRGLYINPTLTSAADFRAIEVTNGNVLIGNSASNTAKLSIKGSGTTGATTAVLVQNSDGVQLFRIDDDRDVFFGSSTSNYIHQGIFFQGDYYGVGNWNFGTTSNLGARLGIKGSGSTSATTSLLVQNSAGTELLKVLDNGTASLGGLSFNGSIVQGNPYFAGIVYGPNYYITGGTANFGASVPANASAQLELTSTTKGFLPPRMTTTQINAIASPATGLEVFNTTLNCTCFYNGTSWRQVTHTAM
jgi:hypothetical protein